MENKFGFTEILKVRFSLKNGDCFFSSIFSADLFMNKKTFLHLLDYKLYVCPRIYSNFCMVKTSKIFCSCLHIKKKL